MTYSAHCFNQGTLQVNTKQSLKGNFDTSGALAAYEFKTLQDLVETAKDYDFILRSNNKLEKGSSYTVRKAKNDFNRL